MTATSRRDIGTVVRSLRLRKGYSQAEIAHRYGVAQPYISRLERGTGGDIRDYFDFLTLLPNSGERSAGAERARRKGTAMLARPDYHIIEDAKDIRRARAALINTVKDAASDTGKLTLGHQGNTFNGKAYYLENQDIWTVFGDASYETLWNTYGVGNPFDGAARDMVCHLTVPAAGINRRVGAVYARDDAGTVFIMHRGKIGGGREGLGKSSFWAYTKMTPKRVHDGDRVTEMGLVGRIGSKTLLRDIAAFVREVKRVKDDIVDRD